MKYDELKCHDCGKHLGSIIDTGPRGMSFCDKHSDVDTGPQTEQAEASSLSDLLNGLLVEEEGYKGDCAEDNPDHWSRGYNNGCLKTVQRIIRKIKMAT